MSIILGALGGMGQAATEMAATNQKAWLAQDQAKLESDLALQRTQALEVFKQNLATTTANQQREAQVGRINAAAGTIADTAVQGKADTIKSGIVDQASWTPEQQAAVDQSLALDKNAIASDPKTRIQAAIQTGDISPTDAMKTSTSMEINQLRLDNLLARADDKNATMQQIAQIRADAITAAAQLRVDAANQRALNGKIDTATGRMLITSEDANIKAATSQLNMLNTQLSTITPGKNGDSQREAIKAQMDELRASIKDSQETKAGYLKNMGLMPDKPKADDSPKPAPAPAPVAPVTPAGKARPPLTQFLK